MSTLTVKPNTGSVLAQLAQITNVDVLKQRFEVLPKEQTHTKEKQWHKAYVAGAVALALLGALAYRQFRNIYATAGLVASAAVLTYFKSRVTVDVATPAYREQCDNIRDLFIGVANEFRVTWHVASNLIAGVVNAEKHKTIEDANAATAIHVKTFLKGTWLTSNDPFTKATEDEKPWRESFQKLHSFAKQLVAIKIEEDKDLHPEVRNELFKVQAEATRLLTGQHPAVPNSTYVEVKFVGKDADAKLIAQPWSAPALKA